MSMCVQILPCQRISIPQRAIYNAKSFPEPFPVGYDGMPRQGKLSRD